MKISDFSNAAVFLSLYNSPNLIGVQRDSL